MTKQQHSISTKLKLSAVELERERQVIWGGAIANFLTTRRDVQSTAIVLFSFPTFDFVCLLIIGDHQRQVGDFSSELHISFRIIHNFFYYFSGKAPERKRLVTFEPFFEKGESCWWRSACHFAFLPPPPSRVDYIFLCDFFFGLGVGST